MVSKTVVDETKLQVRTQDKPKNIFQPIQKAGKGPNISLEKDTKVDVESKPIMGMEEPGATADNVYYKVVKASLKGRKLPSEDVYIKGRDVRDSS